MRHATSESTFGINPAMRLLIADDNEDHRFLSRRFLETAGHEVIAESETFDELAVSVGVSRPDVVVIDLLMPGDAVATITSMRQDHPELPIIVATGMAGDMDLSKRLLSAGASAIVEKTPRSERVIEALRAFSV